MSTLKILDFSNNGFSGGLPAAFGQMEHLQSLDVSRNKLEGSIPASFADSGSGSPFSIFRASTNNLVGVIPSEIGKFDNLGILQLGTCTDDRAADAIFETHSAAHSIR